MKRWKMLKEVAESYSMTLNNKFFSKIIILTSQYIFLTYISELHSFSIVILGNNLLIVETES